MPVAADGSGTNGLYTLHLAQAIGLAAIHHGYDVLYREAHTLVEQIADATLAKVYDRVGFLPRA